ncbi:MAG TPA: hypothetical protein VIF09_15835, partial [Polyangiaceae bacterium]
MNGTFAYVAIGVAIAEWMAFYNCPVLLARLAVVPAGTRYLDVPPRARAALTSDNPPGAYRTTEPTSFDLARLVGPTLIEQPEATMYFARNAARAVGVTPLGLVGRTRSLVRVDLSGSEGRVALHARCYPAGLLPLVIGL